MVTGRHLSEDVCKGFTLSKQGCVQEGREEELPPEDEEKMPDLRLDMEDDEEEGTLEREREAAAEADLARRNREQVGKIRRKLKVRMSTSQAVVCK
jgi:hypothetical protein